MHKRIVESIKYVLENCRIDCETLIQSQNTEGFWKMAVIYKIPAYEAHIRNVSMAIGSLYGEGLSIQKIGKNVLLIN